MAKQNEKSKIQVVLFVEGDTDEVLFKALIDYYKGVSKTELNSCRICNLRGVTRYTSKLIAKLQNELVPNSLKGNDGNAKLNDLYGKVRRVYLKGYQTKELVAALDMAVIRNKNKNVLKDLEKALGYSE